MDVITFEIGDTTIQLVNGDALFWTNGTDHEPDVVVPIDKLHKALGTAHMLKQGAVHNADVTGLPERSVGKSELT